MNLKADIVPALAIGAGVAGVVYLLGGDDAPQLEATGATSNEGAPVAPVGGVDDYIKVYIAQRVKAVELFGEETGTNNKAVARVTRGYAVQQVIRFWEAEVNRLCGLDDGSNGGIFTLDFSRPRVDYTKTNPPGLNPNPIAYRGVLTFDAAVTMVDNYNRHAADLRAAMVAGVGALDSSVLDPNSTLTLEGADKFWNTIGDIAIDVDVDRAQPDYTGGSYLWAAIVESAQELPGRLGAAAREVAAAVGKGALSIVWDLLEPLVTSPWVLGAAGIALYLQRAELLALVRRLHV